MAEQTILLHRTFEIDAHQLTFTALIRGGEVLVEFAVSTHSNVAPLLTLDKIYRDRHTACYYVANITDRAANKLLEYYRREFAGFVALVDHAFTRSDKKAVSSRHKLFAGE